MDDINFSSSSYHQDISNMLADRIEENNDDIFAVLRDYQLDNVTHYEIERTIRTLRNIAVLNEYLSKGKIGTASVFLPTNLPLYSLFVFALITAFQCERVIVRPNSIMQESNVISRLVDRLRISDLLPHVFVANIERTQFMDHIRSSDLVVFTGKPVNAMKIVDQMKPGATLLNNGSGHNPIVIAKNADLDRAIADSVYVKAFNSGQDCAGPDVILVHKAVSDIFISRFSDEFSNLKTGQFGNTGAMIGPINRMSELKRLAEIIKSNQKDVVAGGAIDFVNNIVAPTVIARPITECPNYHEMFGPIAFIHTYEDDDELAVYFEDPEGRYIANSMYVSLYGDSEYLESRKDDLAGIGILLKDQIIHDIEIGYIEYGGYSLGASGIVRKGSDGSSEAVAMPLLIPRIIANHMISDEPLPEPPKKYSNRRRITELDEYNEAISTILGGRLGFGFLSKENDSEDSWTSYICTTEPLDANKRFIDLANKYGSIRNEIQILDIKTLRTLVAQPNDTVIRIDAIRREHPFSDWLKVLKKRKFYFIGDGKLLSSVLTGNMKQLRDVVI